MLGICGLHLLEQRTVNQSRIDEISVEDIIDFLLKDDPGCDRRQLHLVDSNGNTAAWTGENCIDWSGHLTFPYFSVAGNMLVGKQVQGKHGAILSGKCTVGLLRSPTTSLRSRRGGWW